MIKMNTSLGTNSTSINYYNSIGIIGIYEVLDTKRTKTLEAVQLYVFFSFFLIVIISRKNFGNDKKVMQKFQCLFMTYLSIPT